MELRVNLLSPQELSTALTILTALGAQDSSLAPVRATPDVNLIPPFPGERVAPTKEQTSLPLEVPAAPSTAAVELPQIAQEDAAVIFGTQAVPVAPVPPVPTLASQAAVPPVPATLMNPADAVELDSAGQPWDPEKHAGTRTKNADGRWKAKRGAAPTVPTPPMAKPAQSVGLDFQDFLARVAQAITSGKIPPHAMQDALQECGFASIVDLQAAPESASSVWGAMVLAYPELEQ